MGEGEERGEEEEGVFSCGGGRVGVCTCRWRSATIATAAAAAGGGIRERENETKKTCFYMVRQANLKTRLMAAKKKDPRGRKTAGKRARVRQ